MKNKIISLCLLILCVFLLSSLVYKNQNKSDNIIKKIVLFSNLEDNKIITIDDNQQPTHLDQKTDSICYQLKVYDSLVKSYHKTGFINMEKTKMLRSHIFYKANYTKQNDSTKFDMDFYLIEKSIHDEIFRDLAILLECSDLEKKLIDKQK